MPKSDDLALPPSTPPSRSLALPPGVEGVDGAELFGEAAFEAKVKAAKRAGLVCSACSQPIDDHGFEYVSFRTEMNEGDAVCVTGRAFICSRECCTDARATLENSAGARRQFPGWHFFYREVEEAPDAPPPDQGAEAEPKQ